MIRTLKDYPSNYLNTNMVDAIEDGRIVRVSEDYAQKEGLLILRKQVNIDGASTGKKVEDLRKNKGFIGMEDLRKPLSAKNNEILRELVDNFHWTLLKKRKDRVLTRKKVAEAIDETELSVKMIESGVLPADNFILINKLESYYGISLRKNAVAEFSGKTLRRVIDFAKKEEKNKHSEEKEIEIVEEEKPVGKSEPTNSSSDDFEIIDLGKA